MEPHREASDISPELDEAHGRIRRLQSLIFGLTTTLVVLLVVFVFSLFGERSEQDRDEPSLEESRASALEILRLLSEDEIAAEASEEAFAEARRLIDSLGVDVPPEALRTRSAQLLRAGETAWQGKDIETARSAWTQARDLARILIDKDPSDAAAHRDLAETQRALGEAAAHTGAFDEALVAHRAAAAAWQALAELQTDRPEWRRERATEIGLEAEILRRQNDLDGALAAWRRALEIRSRLVEEDPENSQLLNESATVRERIGALLQLQGDLEGARRQQQQALEIRTQGMDPESDDPAWIFSRSMSQLRIADVLTAEGRYREAESKLRSALEMREELTESEPENPVWLQARGAAEHRLCDVLRLRNATGSDDALELCSAAVDSLAEAVQAADQRQDWVFSLASAQQSVGDLHLARGDVLKAKEFQLRAFNLRSDMASRSSAAHWRKALAASHLKLGDLARRGGESGAALGELEKAREILQALFEESEGGGGARDLAAVYHQIGSLHQQSGDLPAAQETLEEALRLTQTISDQSSMLWTSILIRIRLADVDVLSGERQKALKQRRSVVSLLRGASTTQTGDRWVRALAIALRRLGELETAEGSFNAGAKALEESLQLLQEQADANPDTDLWRREAAETWSVLAQMHAEREEFQPALTAQRSAREIHEKVAQTTGAVSMRRAAAASWREEGDLLKRSGEAEAARDAYRSALEIYDRIAKTSPLDLQADLDVAAVRGRLGAVLLALDLPDAARVEWELACASTLESAWTNPEYDALQRSAIESCGKFGEIESTTNSVRTEQIRRMEGGLGLLERLEKDLTGFDRTDWTRRYQQTLRRLKTTDDDAASGGGS